MNFFIVNDISSSVKRNDVNLALVLYENNDDILGFFIGINIDAQKLLQAFA